MGGPSKVRYAYVVWIQDKAGTIHGEVMIGPTIMATEILRPRLGNLVDLPRRFEDRWLSTSQLKRDESWIDWVGRLSSRRLGIFLNWHGWSGVEGFNSRCGH